MFEPAVWAEPDSLVAADPAIDDPTWLDAFPLLAAFPSEPEGAPLSWVTRSVESPDIDPNLVAAWIGDVAAEHLPGWRLDQLFPLIDPSQDVLGLPGLSTRARNALRRFGAQLGPVLEATVRELFDLPNIGALTVSNVIESLASANWRAAVSRPSDTETEWLGSPGFADVSPLAGGATGRASDANGPLPDQLEAVLDATRTLARWQRLRGRPDLPLVDPEGVRGAPPAVVDAHSLLTSVSAHDVDNAPLPQVAQLLEEALGDLDERELHVARERLFREPPETLDAIGRSLGVTRERVRQIESKIKARLGNRELSAFTTPTGEIAAVVRQYVGSVCALDRLIERFPELGSDVVSAEQPAWRVLDWLDDELEIVDGWACCPSVDTVTRLVRDLLDLGSDEFGVASIGSLREGLNLDGAPDDEFRAYLGWLGYETLNEYVLTRTGNLSDRAGAVLSIRGEPMTAEQLVETFAVSRSPGALKNALVQDERFTRVNRDQWALAQWGLESYTGIRDLIRRELQSHEGSMELTKLVDSLTTRFSVASNSVITFAAAPPFQTVGGLVSMAIRSHQAPRKTPGQTKRLYRQSDGWAFRVVLNADHMRGSGFSLPVGAATALGLEPGSSSSRHSSLGDQAVFWTGAQPACGTIRRFLVRDDAQQGQQAILVFGDDGGFDVRLVTNLAGEANEVLRALVGADPASGVQQALCLALGMPDDSTWIDLVGRARDRGEDDVVQQMLSVERAQDSPGGEMPAGDGASVQDILDLL